MKPGIKARWLAALRSHKYKQGIGALRNKDKFCCLGVLCDLHRKKHHKKWRDDTYYDETYALPDAVIKWAGLRQANPVIPNQTTLGAENDCGKNFNEIADLIGKHL